MYDSGQMVVVLCLFGAYNLMLIKKVKTLALI